MCICLINDNKHEAEGSGSSVHVIRQILCLITNFLPCHLELLIIVHVDDRSHDYVSKKGEKKKRRTKTTQNEFSGFRSHLLENEFEKSKPSLNLCFPALKRMNLKNREITRPNRY